MPDRPFSSDAPAPAFALLRREAIDTHLEGDGLTVRLLCATASETIEALLGKDKLTLSLKDVAWVFIFELHWMLDYHTAHFTVETIQKVPRRDAEDEALGLFLDCYWSLISVPMSPWPGVQAKFNELNLGIFAQYDSNSPPDEYVELITHLIELAWFRTAGRQEWLDFLADWKRRAPTWILGVLSNLETRLFWQSRLLTPSTTFPKIEENEINTLSKCSDFADLWLLNLYGRHEAIVARVKQLSAQLPANSYQRRVILDFWHLNRSFVKNVSRRLAPKPQVPAAIDVAESSIQQTLNYEENISRSHDPKEDSQMLWLARRRSISASLPLLQFHDRRDLEIEGELAALFRERTESNAFRRAEAMRLAMLHELAAMRIWDYGMWRDAEKAQSELWLESALWIKDDSGSAVNGLILSARALSLKVSKSDYLTSTAIDRMEFAPPSMVLLLSDQLLFAYPLAKYSASGLIEEIADLFPSSMWPLLADWTVIASKELDEHRSTGQKMGFAAFWWKLLPELSEATPIWTTLLPEALKMANIPYCWNGKHGRFLHFWMRCAPMALCNEVAEVMIQTSVPADRNIFSLYRAELLVETEETRPDLGRSLSSRLPRPAPTLEERLVLAEHLGLESYSEEDDYLAFAICCFIERTSQ